MSTISYGYTQSASTELVGPRFLRITDIQDGAVNWESVPFCRIEESAIEKVRLAHNDIVFARTGATTGKSFLVQEPPQAVFASYLIRLRLRTNQVLPSFLNLYFQTADYWRAIAAGSTGSAQGGFNATKLGELTIRFPQVEEQRRIVAILDEAFEGIATARAHAEKNLRNAREVFTGRLEQIFSRQAPDWRQVSLEEIGSTQTGSTPKTSEAENFGNHIPFIKPGDFRRDGTLNYDNEGLSHIGAGKVRLVEAGSVLMVCIGTVGKAAYTEREIATNQQINAWTPTCAALGKFVYYQMTSNDFQRRVWGSVGQTTLAIINKSKWSALTVGVPTAVEEQRRIVDELNAIQAETTALEEIYQRKLAALDELRQSLLHQAFSGHL